MWSIYHMFCMLRITPQASYRLKDVSVSNNKGLVWVILEWKMTSLPCSHVIRYIIKNLMQGSTIVVGETKLLHDLWN